MMLPHYLICYMKYMINIVFKKINIQQKRLITKAQMKPIRLFLAKSVKRIQSAYQMLLMQIVIILYIVAVRIISVLRRIYLIITTLRTLLLIFLVGV